MTSQNAATWEPPKELAGLKILGIHYVTVEGVRGDLEGVAGGVEMEMLMRSEDGRGMYLAQLALGAKDASYRIAVEIVYAFEGDDERPARWTFANGNFAEWFGSDIVSGHVWPYLRSKVHQLASDLAVQRPILAPLIRREEESVERYEVHVDEIVP